MGARGAAMDTSSYPDNHCPVPQPEGTAPLGSFVVNELNSFQVQTNTTPETDDVEETFRKFIVRHKKPYLNDKEGETMVPLLFINM